MVEFALVFPLFILLLSGMVDFGMYLYSEMTVTNAVRDGARLGTTACSVLACTEAVQARVVASSGGLLQPGDVQVQCIVATGPNAGLDSCKKNTGSLKRPAQDGVVNGDSVTVKASYTYHMIWPLAFGSAVGINSSVTFMVE
jgi:Flp pilus assembly protein TadG